MVRADEEGSALAWSKTELSAHLVLRGQNPSRRGPGVIEPTLQTRTAAIVVAALAWLAPKPDAFP